MPHELSKKPICCGGESELESGSSMGNGTKPRNMQPYQAVIKLCFCQEIRKLEQILLLLRRPMESKSIRIFVRTYFNGSLFG